MTTETTFFSYSRADSTFALKLAKDLRNAGADLWLDQLDIKPGSHWDASIENALNASACMIVILSPSSVASNNVMDEVSYALESNKKVIPVLLSDCTAPFRLRRLQRIDFTGDYQTGFNHLLEALNHSISDNKNNVIKEPAPVTRQTPEPDNSYEKQKQQEEEENKIWKEACRLNSVSSYKKYINETTSDVYKEKAQQLIEQIEAAQKEKELETELWEKAKTENVISLYNHYLQKYPRGIYKTAAIAAIKKIEETEMQKQLVSNKKRGISAEEKVQWRVNKKYFRIGTGIILLGLLIWATIKLSSGDAKPGDSTSDADTKAWNNAQQKNDSNAYALYQKEFPNGTYVNLAQKKLDLLTLRVFKGAVIQEFKISSYLYSVAFSPDGKTILTGSWHKTACLWDLNGNIIREFKGHLRFVIGVAFSPDGKTILTGSSDSTACLWDLNGNKIQEFKGHLNGVSSVAFSPDGKTILTSSYDKTARLWDLNGNTIQIFKDKSDLVFSVAFSPDGKTILTGSNLTASLWDLNGNKIQEFKGHSSGVFSVAFSPDGRTILTGSWDKTARLWDLNGNKIQEFKGHSDVVESVAFSPDGKTILTGSWDKTARLWDLNGNIIQEFKGHSDHVTSVAFSPDGKKILTGSDDNTARLWE